MSSERTVIITGGATSIGAEIVRTFAAAGYRVAIADIAAAEGEALAQAIGPQACFLATDLAVDADIARCVSETVATFGTISAIIHAACSYVDGGIAASREDWRRSLDVNLVGAALLVREARPHLVAPGGAIVLIGSISAKIGQAGRWLYPASKAALLQLTRSMALDLASSGIRVNSLSPGKTWSVPLQRKHANDRPRADAVEGAFHALGRLGDAAEIARAALFLVLGRGQFHYRHGPCRGRRVLRHGARADGGSRSARVVNDCVHAIDTVAKESGRMRSIGIVGGGHAGLQLGIGLRQRGYAVTIVTDRTPEDVRNGRIMSSQGMQRTALQHERGLGLAFWDDIAPKHDFIEFSLAGENRQRAIHWRAPVPSPGNSVCQRIKIPRWSEEFTRLGGAIEVRPAGSRTSRR